MKNGKKRNCVTERENARKRMREDGNSKEKWNNNIV